MSDLGQALDGAWASIGRGDVDGGLDPLVEALARARSRASPEAWSAAIGTIRRHPLCKALHEDPFIFRCFSRPRGYAGDGVALDYLLRRREAPLGTRPPLATRVHHYVTTGPFARAVRFRRDQAARQIDECAAPGSPAPSILAAWAGHLRELDASAAARDRRLGRVTAFDHDARNLEVVRGDYAALPVRTVPGSLRELVEGRHDFAELDLVFCAGVMETLPPASAQGLVRALFGTLAPGGRLVVPSLLPTLPDAALLEAFLDWRLALRSERDIFALASGIPKEEIGSWLFSANEESTIGVLVVQRRR